MSRPSKRLKQNGSPSGEHPEQGRIPDSDERPDRDELPFEPAGPWAEHPACKPGGLFTEEPGDPFTEEPGDPFSEEPGDPFAEEPGHRMTDQPSTVGLPDVRPIAVMPGCLYLVGTPIGNLGDLSPRAAAVLAAVDRIAAEDTRRTLRLLSALGIRKSLVSYHEHNLRSRGPQLVERLAAGETIALVSDAGMPSISDPGEDLVRLCIERGIPVAVIPGPTAAMTALAMSGLPTGRFAFEGFLPASGPERRLRLAALATEPRTLILYEAPHRLAKLLAALVEQGLGARRIVLGRELTKRFEELTRGTVSEALASSEAQPPRGEYVVILEGHDAFASRCPQPATPARSRAGDPGADGSQPAVDEAAGAGVAQDEEAAIRELLIDLLRQGLSVKDAAREAARRTGQKRSTLYARAQSLKAQADNDR